MSEVYSINNEQLKLMLEEAARTLFGKQPDIFEFTSETGQTEWNLAHYFDIGVHKLFPKPVGLINDYSRVTP